MQADPQISAHEIGPRFSSSGGAMIHRLCRVKLAGGFAPIGLPSARLCTDQFIRTGLRDKIQRIACRLDRNCARLDKRRFSMQKAYMIKAMLVLAIGIVAAITASCANSKLGGATAQSAAAQRDYERLSGTWQLTRAVVNGRPVPANVLRNTILITDRNTFRFPKASGVGTHPAGSFTVNPDTKPKQVDSIAEGGPNAGHLTRGIYEILDANHKRACWGPPGGPRPTEFKSPPGSRRILQYWTKIGPVPSH